MPRKNESIIGGRRKGRNWNTTVSYTCIEQEKLETQLSNEGFIIQRMDEDGNCMFRSLADQLVNDASQHMVFRKKVIEYMSINQEHFAAFVEDDEPVDAYLARMRTSGEWGGHAELYAASQTLAITIQVYQSDTCFLLQAPSTTSAYARTVRLSYHGECHYNSVRAADGSIPAASKTFPSSAFPSSNVSDIELVERAVKWAPSHRIRLALRLANNRPEDAIELLLTCSEQIDELELIENLEEEERKQELENQGKQKQENRDSGTSSEDKSSVTQSRFSKVKMKKVPALPTMVLSKKDKRKQKKPCVTSEDVNSSSKGGSGIADSGVAKVIVL